MAKGKNVYRAPEASVRRRRTIAPKPPTRLRDVEVHRIFGDADRMMRVEWNEDGTTAVRRPIPLSEAEALMRDKHPPFCMDNMERPGWKYYYYWSKDGWASRDVQGGDPLCEGI